MAEGLWLGKPGSWAMMAETACRPVLAGFIGADPRVLDLLDAKGIPYIIHLP